MSIRDRAQAFLEKEKVPFPKLAERVAAFAQQEIDRYRKSEAEQRIAELIYEEWVAKGRPDSFVFYQYEAAPKAMVARTYMSTAINVWRRQGVLGGSRFNIEVLNASRLKAIAKGDRP